MKRKHVIATFALSALMGIGIFAGVRANKVKEANAATATTVYCAVDVASLKTTYSISDENFVMKCNVNRKGDGDDWATYTMLDTKSVYDSKTVYSASFTDLYDGLGCIQFQVHDQSKGDKSWQEQDQVFGTKSWTSAATYNGKIHVYGGSGWATYTPSSYKVNVYVDGNLRGEETVGAGALPVTPTLNFGQRFSGWFNNAEMTEGHEVEAITGATTVYGAVINIPTVTYNLDLTAVSEAFAHPYLHAWNNLKNHEWPGVALTGNTFTVPNDAQIIIANSADGSTVTAQTVDIAQSGVANDTLTVLATQTEGKYNYVWESEKCTATLSVKFDADVPDYADIYIPGAFNGWSDDVTVSKMTRVSDTEFTYALNDIMPGTYGYKIVACYTGATEMDWDHQITTSDQSLEFKAEDDGKTIDLGTKTYDFATNMPAPVEPDVPAEEGYYICGLDGWRYENATKMVAPSTVPGNVAHYMGLEAKVDDEIRVRSYYDDRTLKDQWATVGNGEETYGEKSGDNFKFTKAGTYDVYAYYIGDTFKFSVAEHVDSYTVEMTGVNFNGKAAAGTVALADQTAYSSANFEPNLPEQNGYVARGVYEDEACTTAYTPKVFDAAGHLYVKYTKIGVYMVGDDTFSGADLGWTVDGATILPAAINDTENNLYEGTITITGASVQNPVEVRPANYTSEGELDYSMVYSLGVAYDFAKKVGNNIQFTENGTFAVYFNKSNQIYLNKGADAFYTKFLTEVGGICDPDGDTNLTNLASVWAAQEDAFNSLSKTERDAIKAVGFDGGDESGDDLHKVIAKYHYILTKYGTAVLNDFIFNQTNIEANVNTIGMTADDTTMTVVVISAIAVIAAAGLFFLIRRKRRLVK